LKKFKSAEEPELEGGVQYHIRASLKDIRKYILLPGDPKRAEKIAEEWDEKRFVVGHREYVIYVGKYKGVDLMTCSTGIGGPAAGIAVEELSRLGADTFIRVGSTGSILPEARVGDLIISIGAVRLDGTSKQYIIPEYPALASYEVIMALIEAAESFGYRYHVGITASTDSFYVGQGRRGCGGYWQSWMDSLIPDLQKARVINFEMEASTVFTLASLFGRRAGVICAVYADRVRNEFGIKGEKEAIKVANEAVHILAEWDEAKKLKNKRYFYPSLL